eukprot:symbB.v1.2.020045.t1/scaffold1665.1/size106850/6
MRFDQANTQELLPPCFATQELLPQLLKEFESSSHNNIFEMLQVLWQTIADFLLMPEGHCPICLVKHHVDGNLWRRNLVTTEL